MKVLWLFALTACNAFYGLDSTEVARARDRDEDGKLDAEDNCPDDPNTNQSDEDEDGLGDRCDNCPLIANSKQESRDGDRVGDVCDQYPIAAGDCLILLDAFDDPQSFETHWNVIGAPAIAYGTRSVIITPRQGVRAALLAKNLTGAFDVQVRANAELPTGRLYAVHHATAADDGYACGVGRELPDSPILSVWAAVTADESAARPMSTEPVGGETYLRLVTRDLVGCGAFHGVAAGIQTTNFYQIPPGSPGVRIVEDRAEVYAIALYQSLPACPPTIYR